MRRRYWNVIETLLQSVLLHSAGFCNGQAGQLHRDIYNQTLPTFHEGKQFYNFRRTIWAFLNYAALWPSMKTRRFSTNTGLSISQTGSFRFHRVGSVKTIRHLEGRGGGGGSPACYRIRPLASNCLRSICRKQRGRAEPPPPPQENDWIIDLGTEWHPELGAEQSSGTYWLPADPIILRAFLSTTLWLPECLLTEAGMEDKSVAKQ